MKERAAPCEGFASCWRPVRSAGSLAACRWRIRRCKSGRVTEAMPTSEAASSVTADAGVTRNVKVLSLVSFFQDTASEMLYPVLPIFLTSVLAAPVAVVGIIEGVAEGVASVMKAVAGRLADLRKRRPLVAGGYGLSSVSKLVIGLAGAWPLVLVGRVADRLGKGLRGPPRDAIIATEASPANRGRAFGFHRGADTAGAVVGPLLGLGLYELIDEQIRPLFFLAFIPAAISVGLIAFVQERSHELRPQHDHVFSVRGFPRRYWRLMVFLGVFAFVNFTDALLILRAKYLGLGFAAIVLVYALYNLSYAVLSYPAGIISDRIPRRIVFGVGLAVFAVAYTGLGLAQSSGWVWLLLPLYGCYTALTEGVSRAWVADIVPHHLIGTALGTYSAIAGAGAVAAGVWAGLAWNGSGTFPLIVSGVVVAVLAAVLLTTGHILDERH
jgi:MFS family permease